MTTPEENFTAFTKSGERLGRTKVQEVLSQLKPATITQLTAGNGEWRRGELTTGYSLEEKLLQKGWAGKLSARPTM